MKIDNLPKEELEREAVVRMIILGIDDDDIAFYQDTGLVPLYVQDTNTTHICTDKSYDDSICAFQEKYGTEVYAVIVVKDGEDIKRHFLFVTPIPDLWMLEKLSAAKNKLVVWTENVSNPADNRFEEIVVTKITDEILMRIG